MTGNDWSDRDVEYEDEGEGEEEVATEVAEPANGTAEPPAPPPELPPAPEKKRAPTRPAPRPRARTAEERDYRQDEIERESTRSQLAVENEIKLLKAAARSTVRIERTHVNPGLVDEDDAAEVGDAGTVPFEGYRDAVRRRWGGGGYTASGIGPDGKAFGPLPFTISGKSKPLHPEEDDDDAPGAFVDQGSPFPPPPSGPVGFDPYGRPIYGPPPTPTFQLPPHLQPPPGYPMPTGPGGIAPQPVYPQLVEAREKLRALEQELAAERAAHAATRALLEKERGDHKDELRRQEMRAMEEKHAADMRALEARLSAQREDPLAPLLKLQEADRQAQRELTREQEKNREAAQARLEALLAKLAERPSEGPMDKLLTTLITSMVEQKQEAADPLKQVEMLERLDALRGGKGGEEEGSLATQLVQGVVKVLNAPGAAPFPVQPVAQPVPQVGYAPGQPQALPAPAPAATAVAQGAQPPANMSSDNLQWLALIDQVFAIVHAQNQRQTTGQAAAGELRAWAGQQGLLAKVQELATHGPGETLKTLKAVAANPFVPEANRTRIGALVQFLEHPQTSEWVQGFFVGLKG